MQIQQAVIPGQNTIELHSLSLDTENFGTNELLIETERSFISAGTELANYTGADANVFRPGSWCAYPWKPGYANVGTVLEAGTEHRHLIGKRVFTNGVHASHHRYATDARHKLVAEVPPGLSSEEAVAARMAMIAMAGLDASKPQYVRWVVVIGLGMVGNLAAQLFRLTGANVIGVDPSQRRRDLAQRCGIPHLISGTEEEIVAQVKEITLGHMADVAVDAVGHSNIALQALRVTGDGGEVTGNLSELFAAAHYRWITIKGALEWNIPTQSLLPQDYSQHKKLAAIFHWIEDGRLRLSPLLTHVLPHKEIKTAYEGLLRQKEDYVGVVLKWK